MRLSIVWSYLSLCAVTAVYAAPRFDPNALLSRALPTPSIESPGLEIRTGSDAGESAVTFEVVIKNGATTPEPLNLRARIKSLIREAIRESRPILLAWKFTDAKGAQNTGDSSVQFDYNGGSFKGFGEALTNSQAFEGIVMSPTGEELYASDEYKKGSKSPELRQNFLKAFQDWKKARDGK
ncbi:MAG: hypothetical protein NXY57DRAFT_957507 [Lentinula lateritia]|uniref:Uncharacterized protein n=1 Tax=Lentinula lateritia TaxID=40482 RepID=A0ABQ8VIZ0_9AGAR|nr:MAG: hypothetical protein NXY57DRAFT_957507 [Lentinula lateritia]KAJ4495463.1 hypothetical protein C8R41DRAFT_918896 [Lentinula lateritia]